MSTELNWAKNYTYTASKLHVPDSVEAAQKIVANAKQIRGIATRHTFNSIADSVELISLEAIEPDVRIDREVMTASVSAGTRYGIFARILQAHGLALHNMGSLPHISVGGATATATHGSGDANRNLSSAVCRLELITADGELRTIERGDPDFAGAVVHLGALGIVTRLTFDVEPSYDVAQEVFEQLPWNAVVETFDALFSCAYSVSVFTKYGDTAGGLWLKHRVVPGEDVQPGPDWGAVASLVDRHPVDGFSGTSCTQQLMSIGSWNVRLPHFRLEEVPASGNEIQTEYMVDRRHIGDVIAALREFEPEMREDLIISELRSIKADDLWMSTAYGMDVVGVHFSWFMNPERVANLLPRLEAVLRPFEPRPHWGKLFGMTAEEIAPRYPQHAAFVDLVRRYDPDGKFLNQFLRSRLFG